jgi:hypothetical protein
MAGQMLLLGPVCNILHGVNPLIDTLLTVY